MSEEIRNQMTNNDHAKLGVSIVGAGKHALNHLKVINKLQNHVKLISIVDTLPERAQEVAETYGAERSSTNYEEELKKNDVDVVILSLPPHLNAQFSIAA